MNARLILVRGHVGIGEVDHRPQWLNLTLGRSFPTAWYPEDGSAVACVATTMPERHSAAGYGDTLVSRWADFLAESFLEEGTWIVESALLQSPIHGLLLRDIDATTIEGIISRLFQVLSSIEPCLIYLRPSDPGEAVRQRADLATRGCSRNTSRGSRPARTESDTVYPASRDWPSFGSGSRISAIDWWIASKARKVLVHTSGHDRASARRIIRDFLSDNGFPWPPNSDLQVSSVDLSRYAGTYTRKIGDRTRRSRFASWTVT